ncbi:MAG: hypothetical protein U5K28_03835 [Halobacteriales archaeon]|nr:hypothetical protein [Halobacteriales archaeon]
MNPLLLILAVLGLAIGGYLCYSGWQARVALGIGLLAAGLLA